MNYRFADARSHLGEVIPRIGTEHRGAPRRGSLRSSRSDGAHRRSLAARAAMARGHVLAYHRVARANAV